MITSGKSSLIFGKADVVAVPASASQLSEPGGFTGEVGVVPAPSVLATKLWPSLEQPHLHFRALRGQP